MFKTKYVLPERICTGDRFRLIDDSWSLLFPEYWISYRNIASLINIATVIVQEELVDERYVIGIMDIVPEEGRVRLPIGLRIETDLKTLHLAIALSWKYSLSQKKP